MNSYTFIDKDEKCQNAKLYEFLASSYDISNLASKIYAQKNAKLNIISLKKISKTSA